MDIDKEIKRLAFVNKMNDLYYPAKDIQYRIPKEFKQDPLLDLILAIRRQSAEKIYFLLDQQGDSFTYWLTPLIQKQLHQIDLKTAEWKNADTFNPNWQELLTNSLIDEAYYSSWIEGAKTTRKKAEELAKLKVSPQNRSEQMCFNNFTTLQFILSNLHRTLDQKFICEVHKIVTYQTLDKEDQPFSGKYRNKQVYIADGNKQTVDYTPPPHDQMPSLLEGLFAWSSLESIESFFLHPVIRASIIHFYTVYVHPFFDGNGRVARALMYHYLLKHGYEFMKFFSISKAIAAQRSAYYQSILNVEKNNSDLTYFLLFSTKMILNATTDVETEKIKQKNFTSFLIDIKEKGIVLNERQERLFKFHYKSPLFPIHIKKYQKIFNVVYETARSDLMDLTNKGLLEKKKSGKAFIFSL
jgi:Fic family protein